MDANYGTPHTPPPANAKPAWWQQGRFVTALITTVIGASVVVVALVVILARGGEAGATTESATPSPSGSAVSASASAEPTASPTPQPTQKPPLFAQLEVGWHEVRTAVNIRTGPSTAGAEMRTVGTDELLWLSGDSARGDRRLWYSASTITGERGWVVGGPFNDPYLVRVSRDQKYERCGPVSDDRQHIDGIKTGYRDDVERAALRLVGMHGDEACVWFDASQGYINGQLEVVTTGCGKPSFERGGNVPLLPSTVGNTMGLARVEETFPVPLAFFEEGSYAFDGQRYNRSAILRIARLTPEPLACTSIAIHYGEDEVNRALEASVESCLIVSYHSGRWIGIATANGDHELTLYVPTRHSLDIPHVGQKAVLRIRDITEDYTERLVISNRGSC